MKVTSTAKKAGDVLSVVKLDERIPIGKISFKRFRVVTNRPSGRMWISSIDIGLGGDQCWIPVSDVKKGAFDFQKLLQDSEEAVKRSADSVGEWSQ